MTAQPRSVAPDLSRLERHAAFILAVDHYNYNMCVCVTRLTNHGIGLSTGRRCLDTTLSPIAGTLVGAGTIRATPKERSGACRRRRTPARTATHRARSCTPTTLHARVLPTPHRRGPASSTSNASRRERAGARAWARHITLARPLRQRPAAWRPRAAYPRTARRRVTTRRRGRDRHSNRHPRVDP